MTHKPITATLQFEFLDGKPSSVKSGTVDCDLEREYSDMPAEFVEKAAYDYAIEFLQAIKTVEGGKAKVIEGERFPTPTGLLAEKALKELGEA